MSLHVQSFYELPFIFYFPVARLFCILLQLVISSSKISTAAHNVYKSVKVGHYAFRKVHN